MICAHCKADIENDSYYCDQCGVELFACPVCGKTGKGKTCTEDGTKLVSLKSGPEPSDLGSNQQAITTTAATTTRLQNYHSEMGETPLAEANSKYPYIQLVNKNLNIILHIKHDAVIARENGAYAHFFRGKHMQVSSKQHLKFIYGEMNGWQVMDLDSTNGTRISRFNNWVNVPKLIPHTPVNVADNKYLLIANIEFEIVKEGQESKNSTNTLRL